MLRRSTGPAPHNLHDLPLLFRSPALLRLFRQRVTSFPSCARSRPPIRSTLLRAPSLPSLRTHLHLGHFSTLLQLKMSAVSAANISKKRKFVADGVFQAEINEFFTRELAEEGYSGCEVRVTHARTEIIIRATHTQEVLGEKGRRIRELTALVQKRFKFAENSLELYAEKVQARGLSAVAQAESLRYKLLGGLAFRRACYGVLRFVMESGAKGCEVVVSGKLRAARAKAMKVRSLAAAAFVLLAVFAGADTTSCLSLTPRSSPTVT